MVHCGGWQVVLGRFWFVGGSVHYTTVLPTKSLVLRFSTFLRVLQLAFSFATNVQTGQACHIPTTCIACLPSSHLPSTNNFSMLLRLYGRQLYPSSVCARLRLRLPLFSAPPVTAFFCHAIDPGEKFRRPLFTLLSLSLISENGISYRGSAPPFYLLTIDHLVRGIYTFHLLFLQLLPYSTTITFAMTFYFYFLHHSDERAHLLFGLESFCKLHLRTFLHYYYHPFIAASAPF